ncbi:hypothetical protein LP7551_01839 [Roseibium album]|nr:hypothetical protein LP7551_01839 [Roseibium album]
MISRRLSAHLPGLLLCVTIGLLANFLSRAANWSSGILLIDPFTCAIVIGIVVKSFLKVRAIFGSGIRFSSIVLLEIAVFFLGFSLDFGVFQGSDIVFVGGVLALVGLMLVVSFTICRAVGLPEHLAVLVACGNSICGNAAIAAVAPAVQARNEDVVAAVTFSSILGVLFVVSLPLLAPIMGLDAFQFGTFAGLTVYAVPQVVAATAPVSFLSTQVGTAVKLVRVLMLVPAVLVAPLLLRNRDSPRRRASSPRFHLVKILPWFIPGFLVAAWLNNTGFVPAKASSLSSDISRALFLIAMSGLGLSVDLRRLLSIGPKLVISICLSLAMLSLASFFFVKSLS